MGWCVRRTETAEVSMTCRESEAEKKCRQGRHSQIVPGCYQIVGPTIPIKGYLINACQTDIKGNLGFV